MIETKLDPKTLSDEELQAWVIMLEFNIVGRMGLWEWVAKNPQSNELMHGYHKTWRQCALDLLAYKGVVNGSTNGRYDLTRR